MRTWVAAFCFVFLLVSASPAEAQFRSDTATLKSPVEVYSESGLQTALEKMFSAEHFRMSHSYEMSYTSFGNESMSSGMYTNTMMWQFNDQLAARLDVSMMQPLGGSVFGDNQQPRVFLRNAEIAYRPTENTQIHFMVRQSPHGSYMSPYGMHRGGQSFNMGVGNQPRTMFWRDEHMN